MIVIAILDHAIQAAMLMNLPQMEFRIAEIQSWIVHQAEIVTLIVMSSHDADSSLRMAIITTRVVHYRQYITVEMIHLLDVVEQH